MNQCWKEPPVSTISLFIDNLETGGAQRVFVYLANQFASRGYRVDLILAEKKGLLLGEIEDGVRVVDLALSSIREPKLLFGVHAILRLARYFRLTQPKVVLTTITGANLTAIVARIISRRKFRLVVREAVSLGNARSSLKRLAMKVLYKRADAVIALTQFMRDEMVGALSLDSDHVAVIGNPVDRKRIQLLGQDRSEELEIQTHRPYFVAVGRMVLQKGFDTLLHAVSLLPDGGPRFVIVGEGPESRRLQAMLKELEIQDRVSLVGFRANPYPWIRWSEALIVSSRWEGYPNVIQEAQSLGVPVISTNYDRSVEKILEANNSVPYRTCPAEDPAAMAESILSLAARSGSDLESAQQDSPNDSDAIVNQYLTILMKP